MNPLSTIHRFAAVAKLKSEVFDLVIIGGGVTGAGIALDAASRGMKVALLEKRDFASGTSSKSTKLIHGGLRYLKQLELGLVREVGSERAIVHRMAPHLVTAEKMLLPLIKGGTYGTLSTSFGLWLYDALANVQGEDRRKMLDKKETLDIEPMLAKEALLGGGYYAEYRTDDARLTIETLKTAAQFGATLLNYAQVENLLYRDRVIGVRCKDLPGEDFFDVEGLCVVNAAGPWVDQLRHTDHSLNGKRLFLSKGVHIVVPRERLPIRQAAYFDAPDGRMIFAIPRHRTTYIGTTDTPYEGDPDRISVLREDVEYLLDAANNMFPKAELNVHDVESSWAGLRPLIYEEGKSASEMSRKDELFCSPTGLISIAGGKLTGFRKMGEKVVNLVADRLKAEHRKNFMISFTDKIPLRGGYFRDAAEVNRYRQEVAGRLEVLQVPAWRADYLVANYGRQSDAILEQMPAYPDAPETALACAEAWFAIHQEMALEPLDFFERRSGRLYFDLPGIAPVQEAVLAVFAQAFQWDSTTLRQKRQSLEEAVFEASCAFLSVKSEAV